MTYGGAPGVGAVDGAASTGAKSAGEELHAHRVAAAASGAGGGKRRGAVVEWPRFDDAPAGACSSDEFARLACPFELHGNFCAFFELAGTATGTLSVTTTRRASRPDGPGPLYNVVTLFNATPTLTGELDGPHYSAGGGGGGIPGLRIAGEDSGSAAVERAITAVVREMRGMRCGFAWAVSPLCTPRDLPDRLRARGLVPERPSVPQMAMVLRSERGCEADVRGLTAPLALPGGYELREVGRTPAAVGEWARACAVNNGRAPAATTMTRTARRDAAGEAGADHGEEADELDEWDVESVRLERDVVATTLPHYRRFGVWHSGAGGSGESVMVATSALLATGTVAGVYCVSTHPAHRRRGLGSAVTMAAVAAGYAMGCSVAGLQATAAGRGVYARLGFRVAYDLPIFYSRG